jgi:phosphoglycerate dehydrogenase-like enzyme
MNRIIVAEQLVDEIAGRLGATGSEVELLGVDRRGQGSPLGGATAALRWDLDDEGLHYVLAQAPGLQWIHSPSAGVENWPVAELRQREIVLTNAAGVFAIPISEWVLAALLMIAKRAHAMHDAQREHRWANELDLDELCDKTLLILGTGGIGREIAKRAAAFGMRIWGSSRSGAPVEHVERVVTGSAWHELLPEADYVVSTLPLTPETRGMFGATELRRMKPSSWLLNVGRGATVDEQALLAALHDGIIGGAAIDAWVEEPLPPDHPAWTTPNLIIWPHHSGSSPENTRRGLDLFADNVRRFVRGEELLNVVDLEAGY